MDAAIESSINRNPPQTLYALPEILARGKFSKSHLYNLMARGQFPQPVLRMGRFTRWGSEPVDAWFRNPAAYVTSHAPLAKEPPHADSK